MISNKGMNNKERNEEHISYLNEILPDYQNRRKITIDNLQTVPGEIEANLSVDDTSEKSRMRKYFDEFASNSSIHGMNHLVAPRRHLVERILAGLFILSGFACFIYVSVVSWYRYQYDGFITLLDQQQELIRLVKPAIFICPTEIIDEAKFPATLKRYNIDDTPKNREFFNLLSKATYFNMENASDYQAVPPEMWLPILNDLKKEFYYETSLPGKGTWIIHERGICFSIGNYIHSYASFEYRLTNNQTMGKLPIYPPDISDFQINNREIDDPNYVPSYVYHQNQDITEFLRLDVDAMVEIIDPMELYKQEGPTHFINVFEQMRIIVEVQLLHTMEETNDIFNNKNRRKCRFPFDKGLEMWPIYTFQLCANEFRARMMEKACGCRPHTYPYTYGHPICNITQLRCISRKDKSGKLFKRQHPHTVCLYNCNLVYFNQRMVKLQNATRTNYTNIEISIIFPQYKYAIKERFSFIDFMTAVGSTAGLFLGCSVLSAVEVFYYITLRFYTSNYKKQK